MQLLLDSVKKTTFLTSFLLTVLFTYCQPVLSFTPFITGLSSPLDIVNAGDGTNRLFIVQQGGIIRVHNGTGILASPFLNLADTIISGSEQGLLSLAFHPDYETNRYFFVWYTDKEGYLTLARYQTSVGDPNIANPNSEVVLLEIPKPGTPYFTNHNGGKINFGTDGYLYVSVGDGGSGGDPFNNSQNGNSLLGKMLRLDVNNFNTPPYYSIPADNPYISNPSVLDEIWAIGLRNPWRWSFDRLTGDMWIGDVGQGSREEVNFRSNGNTGAINYGWRCYEGNSLYNGSGCGPSANYVFPIFDYPHDNTTGGFSITGGYVYRGSDYPFLVGYYIVADFVSGNVWKIRPNGSGGWQTFQQSGLPGSIAGFGESENGKLYAVSLGGTVYEVVSNSFLPQKLIEFSASFNQNSTLLHWKTSFESGLESFDIELSEDGLHFGRIGNIAATNNSNGSSYSFTHENTGKSIRYYRLRSINQNQQFDYSKTIRINPVSPAKDVLHPTLINQNSLLLQTEIPLETVSIFGSDGTELIRKRIGGRLGQLTIELPGLKPGFYVLSCIGSSGEKHIQKIVIQ